MNSRDYLTKGLAMESPYWKNFWYGHALPQGLDGYEWEFQLRPIFLAYVAGVIEGDRMHPYYSPQR